MDLCGYDMCGYEAVARVRRVFKDYDVLGDPRWPLSQLRKISAQYVRSLADMSEMDKMFLVRLMLYEAFRRQWLKVKDDEKKRGEFEHIVTLMRCHERGDTNVENTLLLTTVENDISLIALAQGYETQLSFRFLKVNGGIAAKMEMRSFVKTEDEEVIETLKMMQKEFIEADDDEELPETITLVKEAEFRIPLSAFCSRKVEDSSASTATNEPK